MIMKHDCKGEPSKLRPAHGMPPFPCVFFRKQHEAWSASESIGAVEDVRQVRRSNIAAGPVDHLVFRLSFARIGLVYTQLQRAAKPTSQTR